MWTAKKKICYIFYKMTAAWLPISQRLPLAKKLRGFWAKKIATCGKNVNIEKNAYFTPGLTIGDHSGVGINCEVYGPVVIGKHVMMGPDVVIYTSGHNFDRTDIPMMEQGSTEAKPVTIGNDVWIGRRAMIMPGVTVGSGSVIGAGAVVTKNIPPYSVVGGIPAKVIKTRI
jgi:maltose O-acetyltransferase